MEESKMNEKNNNEVILMSEEEIESKWKDMTIGERNSIFAYQQLSLDFIHRHLKDMNELSWTMLSLNPKSLTFEVLDKYPSKIDWVNMCKSSLPMTEGMMFHYRTKIKWELLLSHQKLNIKFLILMSEIYRKSRAKNKTEFWDAVSEYQEFDDVYVDAYKRFINFERLSKNRSLTPLTIRKYLMQLNPRSLMKAVKIPVDILKDNVSYFQNI
jgi:hypothetical protein